MILKLKKKIFKKKKKERKKVLTTVYRKKHASSMDLTVKTKHIIYSINQEEIHCSLNFFAATYVSLYFHQFTNATNRLYQNTQQKTPVKVHKSTVMLAPRKIVSAAAAWIVPQSFGLISNERNFCVAEVAEELHAQTHPPSFDSQFHPQLRGFPTH